MAVSVTNINPKDNLNTLGSLFNDNFRNVKDELDDIETIVDVSNSKITSENLEVNRGSRALSTEIVVVDGSGKYKGSLKVEGVIVGSNVYLSNSPVLTVVSGNVNLQGANSFLNVDGTALFDGVLAYKNFGNTPLNGSNVGTYSNVIANVGKISANTTHSFIMDFSMYSSSANVSNTNTVKEFIINPPKYQGQLLTVVVKANSSTGKPHNLLSNNIISLSAAQKVSFAEDYGVVNLIGSGNTWILTSVLKANIV